MRIKHNNSVLKRSCFKSLLYYLPVDYSAKSYGRNEEVASIYRWFEAGQDVSMPGPRRLGKTFVLERIVDGAPGRGWIAVKAEVAGCTETRAFFRELCSKIGNRRSGGRKVLGWIRQRLGQVVDPRADHQGDWYQPLLTLDHQTYFERLVAVLQTDKRRRWVLLIDELPIFLKALHDQGPEGITRARNFMNLLSRLRGDYPKVRWMITGSIGIEPLAQAGNYMGVLAKFQTFDLQPLSESQSTDLVIDLAARGLLMSRQTITRQEAGAIVRAVGWRSAYYLEAVAQKLSGTPTDDEAGAHEQVEAAIARLMKPVEFPKFSVWEEHLRKHYPDGQRGLAFAVLNQLAQTSAPMTLGTLLAAVGRSQLTKDDLRALLVRLDTEGFITVTQWESGDPTASFNNPLVRRWWNRYRPQATA